jgi:RNA polymerase sigma factor (sigma-70 family)
MDQDALVAVYERYHQRLYRYCFSIVGNAADAEDALQNTMVKALRALPGEERQIQLKPWLYRIAHNESIELLRRRQEEVEVDPELVASAADPAETAARRQRLRSLFHDLAQLPERQRGALVMRELGGLEFDQIAEAFETSAAVARQTVYEARIGLRQMEAGREMSCDEVTKALSAEDRRVLRRRDIRAHLRTCADCRAFGEAIGARKQDMAALAPLPAVVSAGLLQAVLGGGQAGAAATGVASSVGVGTGKAVATSALLKSAATVAVVAAVGVSAADRGGLIDVVPGGGSAKTRQQTSPAAGGAETTLGSAGDEAAGNLGKSQATGGSDDTGNDGQANRKDGENPNSANAAPGTKGSGEKALPAASRHGQETAESHGGGRAHGQTRSQAKGKSTVTPSSKAKKPETSASPPPRPPEPPAATKKQAPDSSPPPPPVPEEVGADNPPVEPLQPSQPQESQGATGAAGGPSSKEAR